ncbi:c-type cytochrome [Isoalcanivorax beigongshangi]|uniref:C-type cytochrome n=1 Tax=Isoalcanivorax beigongshangi TaxID=3238810 RepID=A0ABV4AGT4_9GAMM
MKRLLIPVVVLALAAVLGVLGWQWSALGYAVPVRVAQQYPLHAADGAVLGRYRVPADTAIVQQPNAEQILYGKRLLNETARLLPDNVGSGLNCNSCHMAQGRLRYGANYFNTAQRYPRVMPRAGREVDLAGRINGCFQRSMNGTPLPVDSEEMAAMQAYYRWLAPAQAGVVQAPGEAAFDTALVGNAQRGQVVYAGQCASCHGDQGQGMKDQFGDYIFPPLWGPDSFNIGAGMARVYKAATFVQHNMPMGTGLHVPLGQGGVLSAQEAVDVAQFFTHQPRPDFAGKDGDWPHGNKPVDARY